MPTVIPTVNTQTRATSTGVVLNASAVTGTSDAAKALTFGGVEVDLTSINGRFGAAVAATYDPNIAQVYAAAKALGGVEAGIQAVRQAAIQTETQEPARLQVTDVDLVSAHSAAPSNTDVAVVRSNTLDI